MLDLTTIIITRNEEKTLEDCLKSLHFVNQIILVDSKSTDKTQEIGKKYKATIFEHDFKNFAETRNFALTKVKTRWVMYIDADERISDKLRQEIVNVLNNDNYSAYKFIRTNYYLGKKWPYKESIEKLFLKTRLTGWYGEIHESPRVDGQVGTLSGELLHYTHRSLEEMLNKTIEWYTVEAKLRFNSHHPPVTWWRLIRVYLTGFINSYIYQQGYKVGTIGLIESLYQGFSLFITYVRLWEMQQNKK